MFEEKDGAYIKNKMQKGEVILFLGAGASHGSTNSNGQPVFKAAELEACFREYLSEYDVDLDLAELAEDLQKSSEADYLRLLKEQFLDCSPSDSLKRLFKYTWYRCYTLNYWSCPRFTGHSGGCGLSCNELARRAHPQP